MEKRRACEDYTFAGQSWSLLEVDEESEEIPEPDVFDDVAVEVAAQTINESREHHASSANVARRKVAVEAQKARIEALQREGHMVRLKNGVTVWKKNHTWCL